MVNDLDPSIECSDPYHSHNAPYAFCQTSKPFAGCLFFKDKPPPKKEHKSLVAQHNILYSSSSRKPNMLLVFTDGSKKDSMTGYAYQGIYRGSVIFSLTVPFGSSKSSSFDAEMFALAHAVGHRANQCII